MLPGVVAILTSMVCAAASGGGASGAAGVAAAGSLTRELSRIVEQAMPVAPTTVVLQTRYFGTVTVNHEAHLARKAACKDCHGPGPVGKIEFTPKLAHDRCRSCHVERQHGPTECRDCHVLPPKGQEQLAAEGAPAAGPPPAGAIPPGGPVATVVAEAQPGADASTAEPPEEPGRVHHAIAFGPIAGPGVGAALLLSSHQGPWTLTTSVERISGSDTTRTLALISAGVRRPFLKTTGLYLKVEGVGGLDAVERPMVNVMPALGGRIGLEWTPPKANRVLFFLSFTALANLFQDQLVSPACAFITVGVGLPLHPG